MSEKKKTKEEKQKQITPSFKGGEGYPESVGVQNKNLYIILSGKKISLRTDKKIKIKRVK